MDRALLRAGARLYDVHAVTASHWCDSSAVLAWHNARRAQLYPRFAVCRAPTESRYRKGMSYGSTRCLHAIAIKKDRLGGSVLMQGSMPF